MTTKKFSIAIHGGVSEEYSAEYQNKRSKYIESMTNISRVGLDMLKEGACALDTIEAVIVELENDPLFNAGTGCCLTSVGTIELDAMIMNGVDQKLGSVAGVNFHKNPIKLARLVMEKSKHCMIVGDGLKQFALKNNISVLNDLSELITDREISDLKKFYTDNPDIKPVQLVFKEHKCGDTVGAVVMDKEGNLACGTSTGGICGKLPGRVGDVPLVGCGGYADIYGASSATGHGESLMRFTCCRDIVSEIEKGLTPNEATKHVLENIQSKTGGCLGVISLNRDGDFGVYHNGKFMPWAYANQDKTQIFN